MFHSGEVSGSDSSPAGDPHGWRLGAVADLHGLTGELVGLAETDLVMLRDEQVCEAVLAAERARRFLDSVEATLLVEAQRREATDVRYGLRTAPWLAREAELPSGVAKGRFRTATKVARHLPVVADALAEGRIGFEHARVLADVANPRIVDQIALIAPALCDAIAGVTFEVWRRDVQAVADLLDLDGGHDPSGDIERNRLSVKSVGGVTVIKGELVGEEALVANEALNAIADELFTRFKRDHEVTPDLEIPDRQTLMALALVEACRRGLAGSGGRAPRPEVTLTLTPAELGPPESGSGAGSGRGWGIGHPPSHLLDAVAQRLTSGLDTWSGMWVTDAVGTPLRESSWSTLLCDPDMYALVVDSLGVPLDMGEQIRFANRAQRRALAARDGGCVFPGCTSPASWTDAHHIIEWHKCHRTDVSGLLSLCRHHHGVAHRKGWSVELTDDGWSIWRTPSGDTFAGQRNGRKRTPP